MKGLIIILLGIVFFSPSYGQKERSLNRKGVKNYISEDYNNAELEFMKALDEDSTSFAANYNRAATLYKLEKYQEANEIFAALAENMEASDHLSDLMHNLGNNLMKQEKYEQSIEAYKNSLRLRSDDEDSRYNLAYAQAKLKQQQEEENKDQDKDKDKNKDDQENKDQNKDDQQDKDDQEQEEKDEQDDQKQNEDEKKEDQEKQQQEQNKELTQEDIKRILQAIQEQEKDVKEKVEKQKAKSKKVKTEKDW